MNNQDLDPIAAEQRRHLTEAKQLPFPKRIVYYLGYFKFPLLITFISVICVIIIVRLLFFQRPTYLSGDILNASRTSCYSDAEIVDFYLSSMGYSDEIGNIYFSSATQYDPDNYVTASRMLANISAGESDFLICNAEDFTLLANNGFLVDITKILPAGMLSQTGRLVFHDYTLNENSDDDSKGVVALGYDISDSPILSACGLVSDGQQYIFCFPLNSSRTEAAITFLDWILHGSIA